MLGGHRGLIPARPDSTISAAEEPGNECPSLSTHPRVLELVFASSMHKSQAKNQVVEIQGQEDTERELEPSVATSSPPEGDSSLLFFKAGICPLFL